VGGKVTIPANKRDSDS